MVIIAGVSITEMLSQHSKTIYLVPIRGPAVGI